MTPAEIATIAGGVFGERIGAEWDKANAIHDAQIIATRAVASHVAAIADTVGDISRKVDWLHSEAQNGGLPVHVGV